MRQFQVSEKEQGLVTWSIAEFVNGRWKLLGDVSTWTTSGIEVTASRTGLISLIAKRVDIEGNTFAHFS